MPPLPRSIAILLLIAVAGLATVPLVGGRFHVQLVTQIFVLAVFAMSLDLLVGFTGLVSFGHAAFYGLGGYSLAILTRDFGLVSMGATLPATLVVCGLVSAAIGWLSIRTSGVYFIMITLAFAQMIYYFFNDARGYGGSDGFYILTKPRLAIGDVTLLTLQDRATLYYMALVVLLLTAAFLWTLLRSPFGQVITALQVNEARTRALGFPIDRYKLVSFCIAGILAGLAGYLSAVQFGYVNPAHMGWRESGRVLMVVILGGSGTLFGPVLGAFVFVLLEDLLSGLTEHWLLLMGGFVVAVVLLLPKGIAGLLLSAAGRAAKSGRSAETHPDEQPSVHAIPRGGVDPILETVDLVRQFAGLIAVNRVSVKFSAGKVHAVIGPNGAGKTTLINMLSGELAPTGGHIRYKGRDIAGWSPDAISRLGIGRSFQVTNLYPSLSAFENCRIAAQSRLRSSMRFFRPASRLGAVADRAHRALARCGLGPRSQDAASALSHGDRRKLEIAMVLATEPELFLLDEPLAGMGAQESREILDLLRAVARDHTLILIEHDMDAVFAIADTLTVMVNGHVIATGPVDQVRADRAVQDAYLGHRDAAE
ncbi:branched-chain amino acid ABC transporter ATP-binding protein/permease [Bradyrhizobium sp.]|uniref:branched-chain amino acid ABC transporter ATP-binding protein/permease n=1 Tax=Bradyrhizobium sp. TaxID=376 RepID=UPI0023950FCD|nr:branched-chain amino acid ABC transporter ATP-binding protein/permease [Bradyrhizobium sp.]MDE2376059.1 branched-chain amino acid ABC transporter ATP-binding protein/permease [Bradyrhizobium sp.]